MRDLNTFPNQPIYAPLAYIDTPDGRRLAAVSFRAMARVFCETDEDCERVRRLFEEIVTPAMQSFLDQMKAEKLCIRSVKLMEDSPFVDCGTSPGAPNAKAVPIQPSTVVRVEDLRRIHGLISEMLPPEPHLKT